MNRTLPIIMIVSLLAGVLFTSCKKQPTEPPVDTTHVHCDTCGDTVKHPCDTCNVNQDSLQKVRDSLAHAWTWTQFSVPGESNLTGVWVFDSTNILIVGNNLWRFNGSTFSILKPYQITPFVPLDGALNGYSIFGFTQYDYWLVYVSDALHTSDGLDFDDYRFGPVNACWGTSSNDMFFVGNSGHIYHYNGTTFDSMGSPTTKNLYSVWGTSDNDVWACGSNSTYGTTILLHYDGSTWTEDPISVQKGANACGGFDVVWACDSVNHRFVATSGALLIRKTDDGMWRSDSGLIPNRLGDGSYVGIAPAGNSPTDMMVR